MSLSSFLKVGDGLKTIRHCESATPADTDYIELSLTGLEEAKTAINSVGSLVSSSCIPAMCQAGGEGLRKATAGKKAVISLTTRDTEGAVTPGPSLGEIACHIEAVGGIMIKPGAQLTRLIQVQVVPGESGEYDIVYSLPSEGRYRMWIRIYGRDIQDSPFQVITSPDSK